MKLVVRGRTPRADPRVSYAQGNACFFLVVYQYMYVLTD